MFRSSSKMPSKDAQVLPTGLSPTGHVHVVILGTGFSGLGMAIRLKQRGEEDFVVLEKSADVGGTWRDNTYPGCACDIPSHLYSFSFALNPSWSRAYSPQREIHDYLRRCAKRYNILPHICWDSELLDASWHDDDQRWHITTTQGRMTADILILGNGPLSEPALPAIPGIEDFEGVLFHSARWKHDYDLSGKRVAVIGTGASAIQFVPHIQPQVGKLSLFLRTPPWILPRLDHAIPTWQRTLFRLLPITQRAVRTRIYFRNELTALALVYKPDRLEAAMQLARRYIAAQVPDAELCAKLTPHYTMGCKRILLSDDFYPALTQPNVEVVTNHIREIRAHSIVTEDGTEHEVDAIICGTGFHVTDTQLPECVHGRGGQSLDDKWRTDPRAYLGTTVPQFPNLFLLIGPNTGLGHNSMVFMMEAQFNYILDCLRLMQRHKLQTVDLRPEAQEAFIAEMQQRMHGTVWTSGCASWYLDANGNNTTLWPGFTFEYWFRTRHFDAQRYASSPLQDGSVAEKAVAEPSGTR
ncbi:MAG TPA: NAD(P)/FAD-dependent oxidoreductase [Ktedonobacteraceae bacterium]|jgi:cation diffusion facilitator CzcD-associated flavoprotein CzcO|nr:NAD(P)/FAD-dependent oxidoreductase [Ktedonobacteraceae bacterium]